jgi:steroid 5-alpha reductase family enzyme
MRRADAMIIVAYVVALAAAALTVQLSPLSSPLWTAALADVVATFAVFAFSFAFSNSSFYDAYWSVAPVPIALYWAANAPSVSPRSMVILALVSIWAFRLTWNWRRGWTGLHHEDWRYRQLKEQTGRAYWLVSALGIHLFPTVQVFLGCIPVYFAVTSTAPLNALDALAIAVTAMGISVEAVADDQLRAFSRTKRPGETLQSGLWAYSRHPNYFGEISFWWGLMLFGIAARPDVLWQCAGALAIAAMFVFVTGPMMDKRMLARRPDFAERMLRISAIVPWPPRRA